MSRVPLLVVACVALAGLAAAPWALASSGSAKITTISVTAGKPTEFGFILSKKTSKSGIIVFKVTNKGVIPHDFKFCSKRVTNSKANSCTGRGTKLLNPGQTATLRVSVLLKGTYEYLCTVPGHAAGGMKGLFKVS